MKSQSGNAQANERINQAIEENATELYLSYLELTEIPEAITSLSQLETLVLTGNKIKELPSEIHQLQRLRTLDVSGNKLSKLPEELCHLPELRQLEAAANQLKSLPKALGNLGNLYNLDVYGNQLSRLPESIHFCHNLSCLRANENALSSLPENFGNLRSLLTLDLSYNELIELPLSFFSLTQLKELYLTGNDIEVPFDILSRFSNQPEVLLEKIRDYQKSLSEQLAREQLEAQEDKIKALTESQLAELIVIKMSHYKTTLDGIDIEIIWHEKNTLHDVSQRLSQFDKRMSDICTLWFCLSETMKSNAMEKVIRMLNSGIDPKTGKNLTLTSLLRTIAKDNEMTHDIKIKSIMHDQQLLLKAMLPSNNGSERFCLLWLALVELLSEGEVTLETEKLANLEATLSHVISSYLREHDLANTIANGLVRLLLEEHA